MLKINLYDFDGTIYEGDSTFDFFKFIFKKHPSSLRVIFKMAGCGFLYAIKVIDKTKMKNGFYSIFTTVDDIDSYVNEFWETHRCNIKKYYFDKKDHSNDIVISASPEFLLEPICKELKVKDLMASKINKKTGICDGINCHDTEKVRRLNEKYKDFEVMECYSDSVKSDKPILELAKKAYLVKGEELTLLDFKN